MPQGEKLMVTVFLEGGVSLQVHTFLDKKAICDELKRFENEDDVWAILPGVNAADQDVEVHIVRGEIRSFVIAPFVRQAVSPVPPGARIVQ